MPNDELMRVLLARAAEEGASAGDADLLASRQIAPSQADQLMVDTPAGSNEPKKHNKWLERAFLGAGAADVASTYYGFSKGEEEANPLINWAPKHAQLPIGIGMELGGMMLAKKLLKNHPNILNALFAGGAGIHGALATSNMMNMPSDEEVARRRAAAQQPEMKIWMNPDYFVGGGNK